VKLYAAAVMGVMMTLALEEPGPDPHASINRLCLLIEHVGRVVHLPEA
jgi:hypothetical protein